MQSENQKILVTSALLYVNGLPHLGHMAGCLLPTDVYSRAMRLMGNEVCYIAGTDEFGTPALVGAESENMPVQEYVDKYYAMHKAIYEGWGISYDFLGRTSAPENIETTQAIAMQLYGNGYFQPRKIKALYSVDDQMFLPDRYVIGTCPHCGYENARGDQCDKCTRVLDPEELINPRSSVSGSTNMQWRETTHLFIMLTKLAPIVAAWLRTKDWNKLTMGIANKWIDEGLQDRCYTRDLKWGVPVPDSIPDMEGKVFYVWFDAPIGYISITRQMLPRDWEKWWLLSKGADKVKLVQFMGKDNVPFHSITFPATLLGASDDYKTVDVLKGFSFLNFEGG
ncbi:MAG: class I tRNA ligase family protein, partial [Alphaproteobacteria bacterium]|nr:class I tRNA ligase family protein [Alphaproteobacteria bacterium]